ncbi:MAG TPA: pilus assembly PilX N-terminal domain-containing protein, partial [Gemmatimonadaceae bacterium]|nr:pilus assembly PilX N-terminal domain-containing protein [Gemmatimonadaceae bacterium]
MLMRSTSSAHPSRRRARRGSALILVLIMTMSLAGLAISAIYLTSTSGLLTRYYDKERDYRFAAEAALALGKSRVLRDSALGLPQDSAKQITMGGTLIDAGGVSIPKIKFNLYGGFTGDTIGRYGQFVTLLASAFDSGGVRHVRRLDLTSESFSRFAMFVDSFPSNVYYGTGEFIRGRAHSNTGWYSDPSAPGPTYYDTVSAVGAITGTADYRGLPPKPGTPRIPYPTVARLANLPVYASAGNLNFAPVNDLINASTNGGVDMSGRWDGLQAQSGTRVTFKPVDVDNDGVIDEQDGMMKVFDVAPGIDTSSLRADLPNAGGTAMNNIVMRNQCGLLITNPAGKKEFFPVARFRESWVLKKVVAALEPTVDPGDTTVMKGGDATAYSKILSYGPGFSRCYPAGSSYLMLTERMTDGTCVPTTALSGTFYAWGSDAAGCTIPQQYGGQDTTFTPTVSRCLIDQTQTNGQCTD